MNFSIIYDICGETTIPINFPNRYLGTQMASQPLSGDASNSGVAAQDVRQKIRLEDPSGDDQISQQPIYIYIIYLSYIFHISIILCIYICIYIYIYIQGICYKRCFYLQRYMVQNGQNFSQSIWRKDDGRCVRGTNWELGGYNYGNYGL